MKKILVLVVDYPNNEGGVALMYVHVRNKYYIQHDIDVTVLNFSSNEDYVIDGIPVITLKTYEKQNGSYEILVLHAPNIRNHYRFLRKYAERFSRMIYFFHGHEVLKINETYPKPFNYMKKNGILHVKFQDAYDTFKLLVWRKYLPSIAEKADFVFVSNWFYGEFRKYTKLDDVKLKNHVHIINNSVGKIFEEKSYQYQGNAMYDFITIRSYMDDAKYGVDLVDGLARKYPQYSFLIIGRGKYYEIHEKPENVTWVNRFLSHEEIMKYIDASRCGLLLTREDTQGVMTCELSVYGIPVITSDIEVCREICSKLRNVELVENDVNKINLPQVYEKLMELPMVEKEREYSYENTVKKEENLIRGGYDFITIRNMLDQSVYCIDLLCRIAEHNPEKRFLLIGRGKYFDFNRKPENIIWVNSYLTHEQMLHYINHSKCALMLTRRDTQGVMACELATYGIPLITSDIPICHEVFDDMEKVYFIDNAQVGLIKLTDYLIAIPEGEKSKKFFSGSTIKREVDLIK